ncbi:Endonuclease 4 [Lathyrus oleraceus]|uniref:Aspergillus nuclease S1 n=1 Tax=Pisum sativum TaxID=3888 RepID=A0A9D4VK52_PEA|nr:Endonuclease 4 [Pisum sativum]
MSKMDLIKYVLEELASNGRVVRGQVMSTEYDIQYTSQKATKRRVLYGYLAQQPTDDCQPRKSEVPDEDISSSWLGKRGTLCGLIPTVLGWGREGHYVVCKITQEYLSENALFAVKQLLPDSAHGDLAALCSWPDEIRFHYHWSSALHYAITPDFLCNYQYCRDCHDSYGRKHRCVTGAIHNYTMQLKLAYADASSKFNYNLTEALLFLSHFVGDVHQPLHVGFTGDLGGNSITVRWYRRKTNLHHVWDNMIIESALKMFYGSDLSTIIFNHTIQIFI